MTMTKRSERLPRAGKELEEIADYYASHDTSAEMADGHWVDPRPMTTTSLRLRVDVVERLKAMARTRGMRHTALLRQIVEEAVDPGRMAVYDELTRINSRLAHIEELVAVHVPGSVSVLAAETPALPKTSRGRRKR